jgi:hypothetical protein
LCAVADDGDLVASDVDLDIGERALDQPKQLVALAQKPCHQVVAGDADLDLGVCHVGERTFPARVGNRRTSLPFEVVDSPFGNEDLLARLDRWVATAWTAEAAASRSRQRWLRQVADESATFAGMLLDLAERGAPLVVQGRGGRRHRGTVLAVGADFAGLRTEGGVDLLLAFSGIASVRSDGGGLTPSGDRIATFELGLAEAIAAVGSDRPRVLLVTTADADGLSGELRAVGRDVVTLRLDGDGSTIYVPMASIAELRITG